MTREYVGVGRHFVGRTADRRRVIVTVELDRDQYAGRAFQTIDHGTVTGPVCLAITGESYAPHVDAMRCDPESCGQVVDDLAAVVDPAPGWTIAEARELADIWRRWHLNTMRAACAHMDPATLIREDNGYGGTRIACRPNVCPVDPTYYYGAAWLVEPLPDAVLARVTHLMRSRSDALYRARGYDAAGNRYPAGDAR